MLAAESLQIFFISAMAAAHSLAGVVVSALVGGLGPKGPAQMPAIFFPSALHLTAAAA